MPSLLNVQNLQITFSTEEGELKAVDDISFSIEKGETVAIVGESGSGKSVTALALARLNPTPPARYDRGNILFEGQDVFGMSSEQLRNLR